MTPTSPTVSAAEQAALNPEIWVDEHGDALFRYAVLRVGSESVAEDLVQETFLGALANRSGYRGDSSIRTWLTGILRRKIADYFRQAQRWEPTLGDDHLSNYARRDRRLERWLADPAEVCENADFWRVFHECADKLPPMLAEPYFLRETNQLSTQEIAEILDITPANVSLRLYRARAGLRQCLDKNWFADERT